MSKIVDPHYEKTISIELLGNYQLHTEQHVLGNGKHYTYETLMLNPYFVVIIPKLSHEKIVMIRQYRPSWRCSVFEFPAGGSEPNETYEDTAKRELSEATGYEATSLTKLGEFQHSARTNQKCIIFLAENLTLHQAHPEEGEFIEELVEFSPREIEEHIQNHAIIDISHVCAWYCYITKNL